MTGNETPRALTRRDLFRLRRMALNLERAELAYRRAYIALRELVLELEFRYGILGRRAVVDVHTGLISTPEEVSLEPEPDEGPVEKGPEGRGPVVIPVDGRRT